MLAWLRLRSLPRISTPGPTAAGGGVGGGALGPASALPPVPGAPPPAPPAPADPPVPGAPPPVPGANPPVAEPPAPGLPPPPEGVPLPPVPGDPVDPPVAGGRLGFSAGQAVSRRLAIDTKAAEIVALLVALLARGHRQAAVRYVMVGRPPSYHGTARMLFLSL